MSALAYICSSFRNSGVAGPSGCRAKCPQTGRPSRLGSMIAKSLQGVVSCGEVRSDMWDCWQPLADMFSGLSK
jgi:hypothetical protein